MIPATVIIDTQNFYGFSSSVVGQRRKADPDGVVKAFCYLGFDTDSVFITVAEPAGQDADEAATRLRSVREGINALRPLLTRLATALPIASTTLRGAEHQAAAAVNALLGIGLPPPVLQNKRARLASLSASTRAAASALSQAARDARTGLELLMNRNQIGTVPTAEVAAAIDLYWGTERLELLSRRLGDISSYLYAAHSNLDYQSVLIGRTATPGLSVNVLTGRFPIGKSGDRAAEKQIDTLCAVECLEATRAAIDAGAARAIIVVSDDDDLSPALSRAASIASGSPVLVVVAGTGTVANRWRSSGAGAPAWLQLDAPSICRMTGLEPAQMMARRGEMSSLLLGRAVTFTAGSTAREVISASGMVLPYGGPPLLGPTPLYAQEMAWGRSGEYAVPSVRLGPTAQAPFARRAFAISRHQGGGALRVTASQIIVDLDGMAESAAVRAPGWWHVGDDLVVANVSIGSFQSEWRVVGPEPSVAPKALDPVRAVVIAIQGQFATVRSSGPEGPWDTFTRGNRALKVGDTVVIWPYESSRSGPGRHRPLAVLLSSAVRPV